MENRQVAILNLPAGATSLDISDDSFHLAGATSASRSVSEDGRSGQAVWVSPQLAFLLGYSVAITKGLTPGTKAK